MLQLLFVGVIVANVFDAAVVVIVAVAVNVVALKQLVVHLDIPTVFH